MPEIIKIAGHPAEVIGGGFAIRIPTLNIFVNDAENGWPRENYTQEQIAQMRERVLKKARFAARQARKVYNSG